MKINDLQANIFLLLLFLVSSIFVYWSFFPYKTVVVEKIRVINEDKNVCRGGNLDYEITYTKYTTAKPQLDKSLVDGLIFHIAEKQQAYSPPNVQLGQKVTISLSQTIPNTAPTGDNYHLNIDATYEVNPIRKIVVNMATDNFNIVDCGN